MTIQTNKINTDRLFLFLPYFLLFFASFIYFNWFAGYIFFYQEKSALFLFSAEYLLDHLTQPGKLLEYSGNLLMAFYYIKILGAFLLSLILLLIVKVTALIGYRVSGKRPVFIPFLVGAGFMFMHSHYQFLPVNSLGIMLQLIMFYAVVRITGTKWQWLPVVLFPGWYFLTGGFAWVFFLMYCLYLIFDRRKNSWFLMFSFIVTAFLFFFISGEYLFYATLENLMLFPYSLSDIGMQLLEFGFLVGIVVLLPLLFKVDFTDSGKHTTRNRYLRLIASSGVVVVLLVAMILKTDRRNADYFQVEKLFYEEKYNELIAYNEKNPSTNKLTLFLNNIALAKTGQLTERFFEFPQSPDGGTLFLKWENMGEVLRRGGHYYYTLGLINEAHRWAYEYMVMRGYTAEGLKMLIKTELINGNYTVAEKYIRVLEQSLFYRKDAKVFKALLNNSSAVDAHPELGLAKHFRPKADFFVLSDEPAANIESILVADSTNRFALEYKFAWLLLKKDVEGVVKNLPLLEKAGYTRLPRHIDEAATGYKLLRMGTFPELSYLRLNAETEQRFGQYYQVFQQNSSSRAQAQHALYKNFANTFWYHLFFR